VGRLQDWSAQQPEWVQDALHRAATSSDGFEADAEAIAIRVQVAHGITSPGDHPCTAFDESCLTKGEGGAETTLLCSIGPLAHVDRLEPGQTLKFALDGVTIVFGENGSGKSGYARAARRLCNSRVPVTLQGNVFAANQEATPVVAFTVKDGDEEPRTLTWTEGEPAPPELGHMTFLDTANARVYVEDKAEILFLPPQVQCLTRLGQLYVEAARICQERADGISRTFNSPIGVQFDATTTAGRLVASLALTTALDKLPSEDLMREIGQWTEADAIKLADIRLQIAQGPAAQARKLRRIGQAAKSVADNAISVIEALTAEQIQADGELLRGLAQAQETAEALAAHQIGGQPIAATGSLAWRQLFEFARQFAVEADVISEDGAFEINDPCPLCQRPLDEAARDRLNAFDAFIEAQATAAVDHAKEQVGNRIGALRALAIESPAQVLQTLTEFGECEERYGELALAAANSMKSLDEHRSMAISRLEGNDVAPSLPDASPIDSLKAAADEFFSRAAELERLGNIDPALIQFEQELRDREAFAGSLEALVARRNGLADRHRYLACVAALNTRPVSTIATALRGELVTPALRERIERECETLGLGHIPLRFTEASQAGKSFFDMGLDSTRRPKKSMVLSEGEQRALAIACFLADCHVNNSKGAIIVDDPVTSLDHQRIRRVAHRFVEEAGRGRQVIIFTHNLLFYQEVLRACADRNPQMPALPCLIQQSAQGFGVVSVNDQPWIAKKVRDRVRALEEQLSAIPDDLPRDGEAYRNLAKQFYTDLRETWERGVEEVVLGGVVERFGPDVKTQSLKMVSIDDEDYRTIFFAMKRASERSGHDQAAARQIDVPDKKQLQADLFEFQGFLANYRRKSQAVSERRREVERPPQARVA